MTRAFLIIVTQPTHVKPPLVPPIHRHRTRLRRDKSSQILGNNILSTGSRHSDEDGAGDLRKMSQIIN